MVPKKIKTETDAGCHGYKSLAVIQDLRCYCHREIGEAQSTVAVAKPATSRERKGKLLDIHVCSKTSLLAVSCDATAVVITAAVAAAAAAATSTVATTGAICHYYRCDHLCCC
eukprot:3092-Heterococcus_DN1.PRE.1